ncbi:SGNH/GDSL hydrolase family protein [Nostoc sp. C117]|uniref:SGNH/GDSL hydrolase family protein n=1 Tax=Nostoc sp. C117 TaxID=3349875 RepID=UPI00370D3AD5
MKKQLLAAGFVFFYFMLPLKTMAANFSQIYAFGDSIVDDGNAFDLTQAAIGVEFPPSPPYFEGRFSNGPVWVEYLADDLGITSTNFAVGGATTGTSNLVFPFLPGLVQQIQGFTATNPIADKNALYAIWAGGNDYFSGDIQEPTQPVNNLMNAVTSLANVGAKNFLVFNLPDLGNAPSTRNLPNSAELNALTKAHNETLTQALNTLSKQEPNLNLTLFDENSLANRIIANKEEFGFTNVTDPCLQFNSPTTFKICNNPDEYLFWDENHPTTRGHRVLAGAVLVAVPESSTMLGTLVFAALGVAGTLKHQQKKSALTP